MRDSARLPIVLAEDAARRRARRIRPGTDDPTSGGRRQGIAAGTRRLCGPARMETNLRGYSADPLEREILDVLETLGGRVRAESYLRILSSPGLPRIGMKGPGPESTRERSLKCIQRLPSGSGSEKEPRLGGRGFRN